MIPAGCRIYPPSLPRERDEGLSLAADMSGTLARLRVIARYSEHVNGLIPAGSSLISRHPRTDDGWLNLQSCRSRRQSL